jgi:four helix bundle protein
VDFAGMDKKELRERFKQYAISVAKFVLKMPRDVVNRTYAGQLIRSASSAAANYSASLRAKSPADFINKFKIVEEELDESIFFFELTSAITIALEKEIIPLTAEGNELLSIIVASLKTLRTKYGKGGKKGT